MSDLPRSIGRFRILRKLGEGGMGIVYAAFDDRLDRSVAIKTIPQSAGDELARQRFWREARVAASLSHPNICQVYEVGEEDGCRFLAMELLEGEALSARLERGPLDAREASQVVLALLAALAALHERDVIHRDVKPSNIFLTPHGVKLLDFGVASRREQTTDGDVTSLTIPGTVIGTAQYMAPEQADGDRIDGRADLFAVGVVLFEMLTGRKPFAGRSTVSVLRAIASEAPAPLDGSPAVAAFEPVILRALAKSPDDRYATAAAMAAALNDVQAAAAGALGSGHSDAMTRLIVLPFRVLRSDADTDFLAFSLPDAITATLSGLQSLVVRSSLTAARFSGDAQDIARIAAEADVNVVLSGTLLRAGDRIRVTTQLVEAPAGTVVWSQTSQVTLGDIFQLQDALTGQIVKSLSVPLTARDRRQLRHDVPATAKAYEYYLRANQLSQEANAWTVARDFYLQSVEEDPRYAPAWVRLARVHRLLGKYRKEEVDHGLTRAEDALQRALALNPDLSLAHQLYALIEVDRGRAEDAMVRLLERAADHGAVPEIFAGLVHACRYCGLLDASVAAHARAVRLDPTIETSVMHTYWDLRRYDDVIAVSTVVQAYVFVMSFAELGRPGEALESIRKLEAGGNRVPALVAAARALLEGRGTDAVSTLESFASTVGAIDPEALFYTARHLAHVGRPDLAMPMISRVVAGGFFCYPAMARDSWLDSLRDRPEFLEVMAAAQARSEHAAGRFVSMGGPALLGLS